MESYSAGDGVFLRGRFAARTVASLRRRLSVGSQMPGPKRDSSTNLTCATLIVGILCVDVLERRCCVACFLIYRGPGVMVTHGFSALADNVTRSVRSESSLTRTWAV